MTPLGIYITTILLYLVYLGIFTYLSTQQNRVYDTIEPLEIAFWVLNIGYVANEVHQLIYSGVTDYISSISNRFDVLISAAFIGAFVIRMTALRYVSENGGPPECEGGGDECWVDGGLNTSFIILWGVSTIFLWLRLINFCVLSRALGPMVQMIFKMLGDIATFFSIMLILYLGFSFALMFIMGSIHEGFDTPLNSALTLFRAILGDFDFAAFGTDDSTNIYLSYFGYGVMLLYLIIGSLVLLNLLIALMATTYDKIDSNANAAIIYGKFELAMELGMYAYIVSISMNIEKIHVFNNTSDEDASFMPPPLNVLAMAGFVMFYLIEGIINLFRCHYCKKSARFDLLHVILPSFLRHRILGFDEQILWDNCGLAWKMKTNEGDTICIATKYDKYTDKHEMKFYKVMDKDNKTERTDPRDIESDDIWKRCKVQVDRSVEKKYKCEVNIIQLSEKKLIELDQFKNVKINPFEDQAKAPSNNAEPVKSEVSQKTDYQSIKTTDEDTVTMAIDIGSQLATGKAKSKKKPRQTVIGGPPRNNISSENQSWICRYCRHTVSESRSSLKQLAKVLKVNEAEMKIMNKINPSICSHCYRVKNGRERYEFVWEIISLQIFYFMVLPVCFILFSLIMGPLKLISYIEENTKKDSKKKQRDTVEKHYTDIQLIAKLASVSDEFASVFFETDNPHRCWEELDNAKDALDTFYLKMDINSHIMSISSEEELSLEEFFVDYIGMKELKEIEFEIEDGMSYQNEYAAEEIWKEQFKPLSQTIFNNIRESRKKYLPLHLFSRYPFDVKELIDDMELNYQESNMGVPIAQCSKLDIIKILNELEFLDCKSALDRRRIVNFIAKDVKDNEKVFDKFVDYLREVAELFQNPRKIKNMLRDVNVAIVERGAIAKVYDDELHFIFDDIKNPIIAIPFFNFMRSDQDGANKDSDLDPRVELWTIRNTLKSLYFLITATRKHVLRENNKLYVSVDDLLKRVFRLYNKRILQEPEKARKKEDKMMISDDTDDINNEEEPATASNKLKYPQISRAKSTFHERDMDDDKTEDSVIKRKKEQREAQDRMEKFHKDEITDKDVEREVRAMFAKLQKQRQSKITETTIDYYRRKGIREASVDDKAVNAESEDGGVKLLKDDVALRFIYKQLSRFVVLNMKSAKHKLVKKTGQVNNLSSLLYDDNEQKYEERTLSEILGQTTFGSKYTIEEEMIPKIIRNNPKYIDELYDHLSDVFTTTFRERDMRVIDALSIIMLYHRIFEEVEDEIIQSSNDLVVDHDLFCKFVDREYDPDEMDQNQWSNKTKTASNLYSSVLDIQQNFITLGQIRQTIDQLVDTVRSLKCGELIRFINKIETRKNEDSDRNQEKRANADTYDDEKGSDQDEEKNGKEDGNNTKLKFELVKVDKEWEDFIWNDMRQSFLCNIDSKKISKKKRDGSDIIDVILENTKIDVIKKSASKEHALTDKEKRRAHRMFDLILSFNSKRITLQQLLQFAQSFEEFLQEDKLKSVQELMNKYERERAAKKSDKQSKKARMVKPEAFKTFKAFQITYFDGYLGDFEQEIEWLHKDLHNVDDLCQRLYPFWSGQFVKDIKDFIDSTEQITGNYEVKLSEFGQLKYGLNINGEQAIELFDIIRFKDRSLSWQQIYNYLMFISRMKYSVQKAILNKKTGPQAEDTTVSNDGMKIALNITRDDESKWLFDRVLQYHGQKVTWRQIREYLGKTIKLRKEIRDSFEDQEISRTYDDKKAEIIDEIKTNVEDTKDKNEEIFDLLKAIQKQNQNLQQEIEALKHRG